MTDTTQHHFGGAAPTSPSLQVRDMEEARHKLKISRGKLYQLIHEGLLDTHRVGTRRFTTDINIARCIQRLENQEKARPTL